MDNVFVETELPKVRDEQRSGLILPKRLCSGMPVGARSMSVSIPSALGIRSRAARAESMDFRIGDSCRVVDSVGTCTEVDHRL